MDEPQLRFRDRLNSSVSFPLAGARKWIESTAAVTQTWAEWRSATTNAKRSHLAMIMPPNTVLCEFISFGKTLYTCLSMADAATGLPGFSDISLNSLLSLPTKTVDNFVSKARTHPRKGPKH